jgi:hypothetical protein
MEVATIDAQPVFTETAELSADTVTYLTKQYRPWLAGRYINCTWDMPELMAQEEEICQRRQVQSEISILGRRKDLSE